MLQIKLLQLRSWMLEVQHDLKVKLRSLDLVSEKDMLLELKMFHSANS
jgi:hypothetical protein